jgi:hypothetical protein
MLLFSSKEIELYHSLIPKNKEEKISLIQVMAQR